MFQAISELFVLTRTRLAPPREARAFDVVNASEPRGRERVAELLHAYADLGGQLHVLSPDRWRILFTPTRDAFIPFQERSFALVGWRDPVAVDAAARDQALDLFRAYASVLGKHAIVVAASERLRARSPAFGAIWVGGEQRFDLASFATRGKKGEKLRLAMNHARRCGAAAREVEPRRDDAARHRILETCEAWLAERPSRRTSSFLRTAPMQNAEYRRYFIAETPTGVQAFLVCSPVSRRGFYLQDLVRRPDAPRGVAELVTVRALETFRRDGLAFATSGVVPFYDPEERRVTGPLGGAAEWCIAHFDGLYRFSGLRQFRAKFGPARVEPVYVLHWPALTPLAVRDVALVLSRRG